MYNIKKSKAHGFPVETSNMLNKISNSLKFEQIYLQNISFTNLTVNAL